MNTWKGQREWIQSDHRGQGTILNENRDEHGQIGVDESIR
jgi:hypothetical protein